MSTLGGTFESFVRDVTGRVVGRVAYESSTTSTRFGYSGSGDTADLVLTSSNTISQRTLALPGGVVVALTATTGTWSYPNIHGDVIATADQTGTRTGTFSYDPFGQPIDPATGRIGSQTADDAVPDNLPNNSDYAWVGQHQKHYEHTGTLALIEMGARVYQPSLGRFLSVNPVEGGVDNAYVYVGDPANAYDLNGMWSICSKNTCRALARASKRLLTTVQAHTLGFVVHVYANATGAKFARRFGLMTCQGGWGHAYCPRRNNPRDDLRRRTGIGTRAGRRDSTRESPRVAVEVYGLCFHSRVLWAGNKPLHKRLRDRRGLEGRALS